MDSVWGWPASKIGLLLELGKFYWHQTPKADSAITIPCHCPELPPIPSVLLHSPFPEEDDCADDDTVEAEAAAPSKTWHSFPKYDDAGKAHSEDSSEDSTSTPAEKIDAETCRLIEVNAVEEIDQITKQMDGVWNAVKQIPLLLKDIKDVPAVVLLGVAEVKMAAEQWTSVFQQVCKVISSEHKISDSSLESKTIYLGAKICVSAECFHLYLQNILQGSQVELKKCHNGIVRMLSLIPKENIPQKSPLHEILAELQADTTAQITASVDFVLPLGNVKRLDKINNVPIADHTSLHDQRLVLQNVGYSNQPADRSQEHCLHEIFTTGEAGQDNEYLGIAQPRSSILVPNVEINNIEMECELDCMERESVDGSDVSSVVSSPMGDDEEEVKLSEVSLTVQTTNLELGFKTHVKHEHQSVPALEAVGAYEVSGSVLEGLRGTMVSGKVNLKLKPTQNQLNSAMLAKLYKDAKTVR